MKIRYLIERSGGLYVAMNLEFGLAVQANTLAETKTKARIPNCRIHRRHQWGKRRLSKTIPIKPERAVAMLSPLLCCVSI